MARQGSTARHAAGHSQAFVPYAAEGVTLSAPPDDSAEVIDFPTRDVPADYPYTRIHHIVA